MIRVAVAGDIPAVLAVWSRGRSALASRVDTAEDVAMLLDRSPDGLLVAVEDGAVVGALIAVWDGWRGNMYRLAVLPEHRRRGIATELVAAAHRQLLAAGAARVTALVGVDEPQARAFWEAAGYHHDAHIARHVRNLDA